MLALQEYLRSGNPVDGMGEALGINVYRHPSLPLVGFKYSQIDSPKTNPVVRDCRGIVLEDGTWDVVAKPFRRFFNAGEDAEQFAKFNWGNFTSTTKEDGSLILLYNYRGEWHVNTSGSFGLAECNFSGKTWRELFWETSKIDPTRLDPEYTYIFEMWTPYNKVVRTYPGQVVYLLSMFHVPTLDEVSVAHADEAALSIGVPRPEHHRFKSMDEIAVYLRWMESKDKTYEGVVIRDSANERYKIKSETYTSLHHLVDNGNLFNPKRIVPLILAGETDEVLIYIPELKPHLEKVQEKMDYEFDRLLKLWKATYQIEVQKDFALAILKKSPFTSLLFHLRRDLGSKQDEKALRDKWRESGDFIIKVFYG